MAMSQMRIFLSHSTKDHHFCLQLIEDLQRVLGDADAVWYDAYGGLHGGDSWWRKIVQELKSRNIFMVVLSPDSMASDWVNDEIDIAWRQKNSPARMRLFPILYRHCEVRADLENLQIISFVSPKSYEAAFEELLHALGLATNRSTSQAKQKAPLKTKVQWFAEGFSHYNAKQYEQAIADYDCAIQLDPQYTDAYYNRGLAYYGLKQYQQAIADYDHALQLDPQYINTYVGRGSAYYDLKQYQQAIADYDRAIQLNPQSAIAYYGRGGVYYDLKQYQQAIADYDRAIQLDPQYTDAYYNRGSAYYGLKQYQQAIADYDHALQLKPQYTDATYWRKQAQQRL